MEICGGQTHTIIKSGIDRLLPRRVDAGPRPRLPGLRHAARADRPGGRDRAPPRGHLHLLRRHAARARLERRPAQREGARRRRAHRLLAARCGQARAGEPRPRGRLLRRRLRDDGARPTPWPSGRRSSWACATSRILVSHVLRAAGDGGDPRRRRTTACRASWPPGTSAR